MNKRIAIPIIGVLLAGLIAIGFLYLQETNKLEEAQSETVALEGDVSALETGLAEAEAEVLAREGDVSVLEAGLAETEAEVLALEGDVSTLETDLAEVEARISPDLDVFLTEIRGLTVSVDGLATPGISGSTITRIGWDWGDGDSEDHWFVASHTYTADGDYTITITAYQSDGLTSSKTFIYRTPVQVPLAVSIPDLYLQAVIREAIDKPQGPIYTSDLESLTTLEAPDRGITDLTGLEYGVNLQYLGLWDNNVSDLSPLAGLINLQGLDFEGNNLSDLSPLAGLINLQWLNLLGNSISDLSPLAGLTSLEWVSLLGNYISDVSPLAGLTSLEWLNLWDNSISDISPLAGLITLQYLGLWNNDITDISPLAGLINLNDLDLEGNNISDISPLVENSGLSAGDNVYLWDNPLSTTSSDVYIPQLEERGVYVAY